MNLAIVLRSSRMVDLGVFALLCVTTIFMVPSLTADIAHAIPGWEGDNLYCVRQMWWMKYALLDLHASPFHDSLIYAPIGASAAYGEMFLANSILFLPVTAVWGPVVSYNVALLASFVLTGFGTYLWIRTLTGSRTAGLVAGLIAAFVPFRFAHLPGHLHMVTTQWMPFALYAFERFLGGPTLRRSIGLGVTLALMALSSWYFAFFGAIALTIYALLRTRPWRDYWRSPAWWRGLLIVGVTAAVITLPFFIPYARLMAGGEMERSIGEMESWSNNPYDFFVPNLVHPLIRPHAEAWFPAQMRLWVEHAVSLGYIACVLALIGVWRLRKHRAVPALAAVWLVTYSVALGPTLHWNDHQVRVSLSPGSAARVGKVLSYLPGAGEKMRQEVIATQSMAIPMPAFFMYAVVPGTRAIRVMSRFCVWTGLMTAGLAGFGVVALLAWRRREAPRPRTTLVLATALSALVLFESASDGSVMPLGAREVDRWLARQPERVTIVELPMVQTRRTVQDFYQTVNHQPYAFGPLTSFFPTVRIEREKLFETFPTAESVKAFHDWGITYVLLTPAVIPNWPAFQARVEATPGIHLERVIEGVMLYKIE